MEGGAIIFNRLRYCAITIPVTNIQRFGSPWNIFLLIYFVPFIQGKHESRINDWERKNMKHKVCSCHYGPLFIFLCIDLLGLKKCICVARWYFVIKQRSEWVSEWVCIAIKINFENIIYHTLDQLTLTIIQKKLCGWGVDFTHDSSE